MTDSAPTRSWVASYIGCPRVARTYADADPSWSGSGGAAKTRWLRVSPERLIREGDRARVVIKYSVGLAQHRLPEHLEIHEPVQTDLQRSTRDHVA